MASVSNVTGVHIWSWGLGAGYVQLGGEQWRIQDFPDVGANLLFSRKLHKNERIWTEIGGCIPSAPFGSAYGKVFIF